MPGLKEVQYYLIGLLHLVRGEPQGWRYLDISERGISRSFWAMLWCLPSFAIYWLWWRILFMENVNVGDTGLLSFLRMLTIQYEIWMVQLVIATVVLMWMQRGRHFAKMVVATNWLSVPFAIYGAFLTVLQITMPQAAAIWILLEYVELAAAIFATYQIFRTMEDVSTGQAAILVAGTILTSLILGPVMLSFLGLSIIS
jgi:hypothetical protein